MYLGPFARTVHHGHSWGGREVIVFFSKKIINAVDSIVIAEINFARFIFT